MTLEEALKESEAIAQQAIKKAIKRNRDKEYNRSEKRIISTLLRHAQIRSDADGTDFNIDADDIVIPMFCPVLKGKRIIVGDKNYGPSLDRIDNTKGYIKGNVRVISKRANWLKSDSTYEEQLLVLEDTKRIKGIK